MPFNHTELELRLKRCDQNLLDLFNGYEIHFSVKQTIKKIQNYYNLSYKKAKTDKTVEKIAASYEFFVDQLSKVKSGELSYIAAVNKIESASESVKMNALFYNLAKACELIFWAAVTFSLFSGLCALGFPLIPIQPSLGIAVSITMGGATLAAGYKALACLTEFKSFNRHNAEYSNEVALISFFQPAPQKPKEILSQEDEELDTICCAN